MEAEEARPNLTGNTTTVVLRFRVWIGLQVGLGVFGL